MEIGLQTLRYWNSQLERVGNALIPGAIRPNHLTYMRVIAVPTLILLNYYKAQFTWMFIVILTAILTDFFDGLTARNRNQITRLGTVLDPMADKILALTALVILVYRGIIHWTLILWMCLAESHIAILPALGYLRALRGIPENPSDTWMGRINPNIYGKMKVLFYSISFCLLFLGPAIESEGMVSWGLYLAYVGIFLGGMALVGYLLDWSKGEV
jgi:CDP-diacylglycerol--glycerol-3-phosphate 3-phosphatidyltransferase